ncbi:MAG: membrane protein insertion efficiency factor YidD [Pseudomonadales bacterium]
MTTIAETLSEGLKKIVLGLIRLYQLTLSPLIGGQCRFYPTCSHYASEAVTRHGVGAGSWLAAKRLARCHPFHAGGVDQVPENVPGPNSTQAR